MTPPLAQKMPSQNSVLNTFFSLMITYGVAILVKTHGDTVLDETCK
jgi:hypothetical protein